MPAFKKKNLCIFTLRSFNSQFWNQCINSFSPTFQSFFPVLKISLIKLPVSSQIIWVVLRNLLGLGKLSGQKTGWQGRWSEAPCSVGSQPRMCMKNPGKEESVSRDKGFSVRLRFKLWFDPPFIVQGLVVDTWLWITYLCYLNASNYCPIKTGETESNSVCLPMKKQSTHYTY